jgi:hypothetical protein
MAIAGHVSREMLEHYSHVRQGAKRRAVESLDNVTVTSQLGKWEEAKQRRDEKKSIDDRQRKNLVGTGRFELPTPRTPSECSTRLSHVPTRKQPAARIAADGVAPEDFTISSAVSLTRSIGVSQHVTSVCVSSSGRMVGAPAAAALLPGWRTGFSSPLGRCGRPAHESSVPDCRSCAIAGR